VNELELVPVTVIPVIVSAPPPLFVSTTFIAGADAPTAVPGNVRDTGLKETDGDALGVPVPVRAAIWGVPGALSATLIAAVSVPVAVGLNTTMIGQFAPAASVDPQVLVCENELALAPVTVIEVIARATVPGFESVTVMAAELVFTI